MTSIKSIENTIQREIFNFEKLIVLVLKINNSNIILFIDMLL